MHYTIFKKDVYDLVLLDLKMPHIDGIAMFRALKNRDDRAIICLMTADKSYLEQLKEKNSKYRKICNLQAYIVKKSER